jgi:hypothetical protein
MDENKSRRRSSMIRLGKWAAASAFGVGGLAVCSIGPLAASRLWLYWTIGVSAVAVAVSGCIAVAYLERHWPEPKQPTKFWEWGIMLAIAGTAAWFLVR